ncbi:MAG: HEPN domain-containing protein [Candidatus Jordarchaeum sp.]|uniref:HEPN domain-containing protein n=1 Tax=Candidatus Jordarchaeum sp. TaxID=2823881 RepID=UPI00404B8084
MNSDRALGRLRMALDDLRRCVRSYGLGDYPDCVFRSQLSVGNACKAVLSILGIEFERTHFPSHIISENVLSDVNTVKRLNLNRRQIELLVTLVAYASPLEEQRAMPRYGWETENEILPPSEIYRKQLAGSLLGNALRALEAACGFFGALPTLPKELVELVSKVEEEVVSASKEFGKD